MNIIKKGEEMEEKLRAYFLSLGYFVLRGVPIEFEGSSVSDVDLLLFGRSSGLARERINVDIKNRNKSHAFERLLWARGVQSIYGFDRCIIATTDKRIGIVQFGRRHDILVLDGEFLSKLTADHLGDRFSEEELSAAIVEGRDQSKTSQGTWKHTYQKSKALLLSPDFTSFNVGLRELKTLFEASVVSYQKRDQALRAVYAVSSHLVLLMDFILQDVAVLPRSSRLQTLDEGLRYGDLGLSGAQSIATIAKALASAAGVPTSPLILSMADESRTDILRDYFSKSEVQRCAFSWARELEAEAFNRELNAPETLSQPLRGLLSVFLDYFGINRVQFFEQRNSANGIRLVSSSTPAARESMVKPAQKQEPTESKSGDAKESSASQRSLLD